MDRRSFLIGTAKAGFGAVVVGGVGRSLVSPAGFKPVMAAQRVLEFTITEAMAEMADLQQVYVWAFKERNMPLSYPGPAVVGQEGDEVTLTVTNELREPHAFAIMGTGITTGEIQPGEARTIVFTMPKAGTYMYLDPLQAPINRVMGLHGALISMPPSGNCPYTDPSTTITQLFNDLGVTEEFPGSAWDPQRSYIWLFGGIDPRLHEAIQAGTVFTPAEFVAKAEPRYFTINGRGGFFSAHDPQIAPHGMVGQPALVRILNASLAAHSAHIHGNHVYLLRKTTMAGISMPDNLFLVDTTNMTQCTTQDWLLPYYMPPDIPHRPQCWPPREELDLVLTVPQNPLVYPMHCHCEMSQSANGGNYAAGLIAHWAITGDARNPAAPISFLPETGGVPGSTTPTTPGTNTGTINGGETNKALPHPVIDRARGQHGPTVHQTDGLVRRGPGSPRTVR